MVIQRKQCLYLMLAIVFFLTGQSHLAHGAVVIPGDARTDEYLPLLAGKRVALFCNQTARIGEEHIKVWTSPMWWMHIKSSAGREREKSFFEIYFPKVWQRDGVL